MGANFGVILVCFLMGWGLRQGGVFGKDSHIPINRFVIYVSLPAITLNLLHQLLRQSGSPEGHAQILLPVLMAWIVFALSAVIFTVIGKALDWSPGTVGAIILTAGLGNTSFVGFPLIEAFYGKDALRIGALIDQPGSFLALSTAGVFLAARFSGKRQPIGIALKRLLLFPTTVAGLLALVLAPVEFPAAVAQMLERISSTLVPLALFSVGLQFDLDRKHLALEWKPISLALLYKLFVAPLAISLLYVGILGARGQSTTLSIFEAAMGPMISGGIVATEYGLNPELAALVVGVGIPLSLATTPLWWWILSR